MLMMMMLMTRCAYGTLDFTWVLTCVRGPRLDAREAETQNPSLKEVTDLNSMDSAFKRYIEPIKREKSLLHVILCCCAFVMDF